MSGKIADLIFWDTQGYKYPGFGNTIQIPDELGGTIAVTHNEIDYGNRAWSANPYGDAPVDPQEFLSGEILEDFSLSSKVNSISAVMPKLRGVGNTNSYSVTLDFSNYKASAAQMRRSDGATSEDTYIAVSRFFSGVTSGYTTIKITGKTLDGSPLTVENWKLYNSGRLRNGPWGAIHNSRVFLDAVTQTLSGRNAAGTQEPSPTPPDLGSKSGKDTALGLCQLPADQRYVSLTLIVQQEKVQGGGIPTDRHDIYVASDTSALLIPS